MALEDIIERGQGRAAEVYDALAARKGAHYAQTAARLGRMTQTLGCLVAGLPKIPPVRVMVEMLTQDLTHQSLHAAGVAPNDDAAAKEFVNSVMLFVSMAEHVTGELNAAFQKGKPDEAG